MHIKVLIFCIQKLKALIVLFNLLLLRTMIKARHCVI